MGEVVVNSEELQVRTESGKERNDKKEEEINEAVEETMEEKKKEGDCSNGKKNGLVMRWEKLLPKMALRVLLVEADDSTRQIIAALLRKCSYKVAAVPDGLKAWEILKGSSCNIDLILTEVDLPSISGYALLTLIMEHDICKNIPVIMMSSQDSVSTVYKCMLRGAADYLVKPIRRNELRNLWQHVWRRQSSLARGIGPQEESVGQDKAEATSENNAASNHSSADMASIQNKKELLEKGSDAESSCTKPDMEAESASVETAQEFLQPIWGNHSLDDLRVQKHDACLDYNQMVVNENGELGSRRINAKVTHENCGNNHSRSKSSREAIDFMGTFASHNSSLDNMNSKFDFVPKLDPRLTRCNHPNGLEIQVAENRSTLRHSDSSAFTRYCSRPLQSVHLKWESVSNQTELGDSDRKFFSNFSGYNSDAPGPPATADRPVFSLANGQTKVSDIASSHSQNRVFPIQIPVSGVAYNNKICTNYVSMCSPIIGKQSGASSIPSPSSGSQLEPNCKGNPFQLSNLRSNSEHIHDRSVQTEHDTCSLQKLDKKLDILEDQGHNSPATGQSATNSFGNGAASHLNLGYGSTSGSNSNVDQVASGRTATERKVEESLLQSASSLRSIQREAALTKFRMKRKDRCYEKKVRYESRKKLAEQRPRVKGQFVRQACPPPAETEQ